MVVWKEGEPFPQERAAHQAAVSAVSAHLGRVLGMRMVSGRWLTEADTPGAMVINEALARQEFPDGNPLGGRIRLPWFKEDRFGTIVGVAADVNYTQLDADVTPEAFVHYADAPLFGTMLLLETAGDPQTVAVLCRTRCHTNMAQWSV
jgi:putative ABC transport system permease protein